MLTVTQDHGRNRKTIGAFLAFVSSRYGERNTSVWTDTGSFGQCCESFASRARTLGFDWATKLNHSNHLGLRLAGLKQAYVKTCSPFANLANRVEIHAYMWKIHQQIAQTIALYTPQHMRHP